MTMSWDQPFFDPIETPNGRKLITLRDAALYMTKLPKAEHDATEWQTAMRVDSVARITLARVLPADDLFTM
jgi:hypothetical protein